jgi:hypothetical protein
MDVRKLAIATVLGVGISAPLQAMQDATPPADFQTAEELLLALEAADEDLHRLEADINYVRTFEIQGDSQRRVGKLYFTSDPPAQEGGPPLRRFGVSFSLLVLGDRVDEVSQVLVFDGQWFVEKHPDETPPRFVKRQVARPGDRFDPLRLGEGPFPIPIGQRREDILDRFEAELLPHDDGLRLDPDEDWDEFERKNADALIRAAEGSWQIKLTPRSTDLEPEDFAEIRLWYRPDAGGRPLPRMARTANGIGDVAVVQLINVKLNEDADIPRGVIDTTAPRRGWNVDIRDWEGNVVGVPGR